jgi:3(or 17)beta-hydroxysteroid dehydrogenase
MKWFSMGDQMNEFQNKVVLITGADGGIGAEIAAQFLAEGAKVFLAGIRRESGEALAKRLGPNAVWIELDVSKDEHWQSAFGVIEALHSQLDILVNNAGYLTAGLSIEDTSIDEWNRHFSVNIDGQFLGCKYAIKSMKKGRRGAIINMSSAVAVRLHSHAPAYGVSKSAVLALTRVAALHCNQNHYGIRVNAVLPGPVDTPMMRSGLEDEAAFKRVQKFLVDKYALERIGKPSDIANIVLFLCSDKSAFVTGAAFTADGGQSA